MADDADLASKHIEDVEQDKVTAIQRAAAKIPEGEPGECDDCEDYFIRLVDRRCGRCRDAEERRATRRAWAA
jgi:hypothetical protein